MGVTKKDTRSLDYSLHESIPSFAISKQIGPRPQRVHAGSKYRL